jgi:hypothetical protein
MSHSSVAQSRSHHAEYELHDDEHSTDGEEEHDYDDDDGEQEAYKEKLRHIKLASRGYVNVSKGNNRRCSALTKTACSHIFEIVFHYSTDACSNDEGLLGKDTQMKVVQTCSLQFPCLPIFARYEIVPKESSPFVSVFYYSCP